MDDDYQSRDHYDWIVVGSGFGGSVAACRLAQAGLDVAVFERGRRWQPGSFPRDLSKLSQGWLWQHKHGLYDINPLGDVTCVRAAGLGGGSLIYANVAMRPSTKLFEEAWPEPYRRPMLDPYFDLAASMLEVQTVDDAPTPPPKVARMHTAAQRLGDEAPMFHPNLAVRFTDSVEHPGRNRFGVEQHTCIDCARCVIGCNEGAKNTLDLNYLAVAERAGAQIATLTEVTSLGRDADGRYELQLHQHGDGGTRRVITAAHVILAAGAIGSTEILLRSRERLPDLPKDVGVGYSANGDFLAFGDGTADIVAAGTGPTITTAYAIRTSEGDEMVVEDGGYPTELLRLVRRLQPVRSLLTRATTPDHDAVLLAMGRDRSEGRITLTARGRHLHVEWDTAADGSLYELEERVCSDVITALGGHPSTTPLWSRLHRPVSVHNLGGCAMSTDPARGVVDVDGQVHGHPGLYVLDGAIVPAAIGVNPSHTITAVAERCIETAIRTATGNPDWRAPQWSDVVAPRVPEDHASAVVIPVRSVARGLLFREVMDDGAGTTVDVTVRIPDLWRFRRDPRHVAEIDGRVWVPGIADGAPTSGATVALLAPVGTGPRRTMSYVLPFRDRDGRACELRGQKEVWHKHGLDVWAATTTLPLQLTTPDGTVPAGTLHLTPPAFARQLRSFRPTGRASFPSKIGTLARFLVWFGLGVAGAFVPRRRRRDTS